MGKKAYSLQLGKGFGFKSKAEIKPLVTILQVSLIEHLIRSAM